MDCIGPDLVCAWKWFGSNVESIVAICALGLTLYQAFLTRKHNRLSVKPHLTVKTYFSYTEAFVYFELSNQGIGPAVITGYKLFLDEKEVKTKDFNEAKLQIWELFKRGFPNNKSSLEIYTKHKDYDDVLQPGTAIPLLKIEKRQAESLEGYDVMLIHKQMEKIHFEINYESMYGDKMPSIRG